MDIKWELGKLWYYTRKRFSKPILAIGIQVASKEKDTGVIREIFGMGEHVSVGFIYDPERKQILMEAFLNGKMKRIHADQFVVQALMRKPNPDSPLT